MTKILLVEDDTSLGATLRDRLAREGYEVTWAQSLKEANQAKSQQGFALFILDVGLPDGTGFEFAKAVEGRPFIFLTAQGDAASRLAGYELGAEEFIPKPFHLRELLLRIRHVLDNHLPSARLVVGQLIFNFDSFTVERNGILEAVQTKDLALLRHLVDSSPKAVSRDEALNLVWGEDNFPSNRTVDNSVLRLRTLLGEHSDSIESVRGVGYRWNGGKS